MSRFFLEWLCGTPLVWQFDEKVRNFHCEKRFSQRGNLEAIYFGSSPMRVGNAGTCEADTVTSPSQEAQNPCIFSAPPVAAPRRHAILSAVFTCPYGCPMCAYAAHAQACRVVFPPLFRACKARSLLAGCRGVWKGSGQQDQGF